MKKIAFKLKNEQYGINFQISKNFILHFLFIFSRKIITFLVIVSPITGYSVQLLITLIIINNTDSNPSTNLHAHYICIMLLNDR